MPSGILGISVSGLNAAQAGILTAQHNIANVNTAGYRRQEVGYSASVAQSTGSGYFGAGVNVDTVRHIYSQFLDNEVLRNQAQLSRFETYAAQASQIDGMLGDEDSGLAAELDAFFAAASEVANDPTSNAARQNLLSAGNNLAGRIDTLDSALREMSTAANNDIVAIGRRVNVLTGQIATLNKSIVLAEAANDQPANDLRDQRDQLVAELNKLVNVSQVQQPDGSLNLYVGSGQVLVLGGNAYTMTTVADPVNASLLQPAVDVGNSTVTLGAGQISGGRLGGVLAQREQVLLPAMNDLNRISIALSLEVNAVHRNGLQYDASTPGGDFFTPSVTQQVGTTGWIRLGDSTSGTPIPPENYTAAWDGAQFTVTRVSDGATATVNPGDEVVMNGVAQGFSLLPNPGEPDASFQPSNPGTWNLNFADFSHTIRMQLTATSQVAAAGSTPPTGPGDNRNMLDLAGLRIGKLLNNGTVSLSQAYDQSVTRTASLAADADLSQSAFTSLVKQATTSQQSLSGVNLDEEAVNLIRYQQAYQASARAIQVASGLFDTLIDIMG
jgi:flagellar hook-associated protein 1